MRLLAAVLAAGLLLVGCTDDPASRPASHPAFHPAPRSAADAPQGRPGCRGATRADVRGPEISYAGSRPLSATPVGSAVCSAYWLPGADRGLVPQ